MSTVSKFAIVACLYLTVSQSLLGGNRDAASDTSADQLVSAATRSFSDLKVLCKERHDLCTSAAGFAARVGETASRIYGWAIHASLTHGSNLQDDRA